MEPIPTLLDTGAFMPTVALAGDAGADLYAQHGTVIPASGGRAVISTGVSLAIPSGYAGFVLPRSGLAANHGITCLNAPGLIDSGFRGQVKVVLLNTDPTKNYLVQAGDRIAQLVIMKVELARFVGTERLPSSVRGANGFGSSGR